MRHCIIEGCATRVRSATHQTCNKHRRDGSLRRTKARSGLTKGSRALKSITPEEWGAIFTSQNGRCYLCSHRLWDRYGGIERDKHTERLAAVDHDHQVEKVQGVRASIRGLLCAYPCNRILRREMNAEWLARGAVYVGTMPAQAVLAFFTPA